jgi:hypothetical protein
MGDLRRLHTAEVENGASAWWRDAAALVCCAAMVAAATALAWIADGP